MNVSVIRMDYEIVLTNQILLNFHIIDGLIKSKTAVTPVH